MLIKNVRVIDPKTRTDEIADISIDNGKIVKIGRNLTGDTNTIDADGMVAAPGLVDIHVHFRDPGQTEKEDIVSGAAAAAKGGFTSVICMANTAPTVDHVDVLSQVLDKGQKTGIHVYSAAAVTKGLGGKERTPMAELAEAGAAGFTDDGIPVMDAALLEEIFVEAKKLDLPVSLHEEARHLIGRPGVNDGPVAEKVIGQKGAPAEAEEFMVKRDCEIALKTGASVNIQHISSAGSVELVRQAKAKGANVYAEATPHHFSLTEDAVLEYGTYAKMNPPLRTQADQDAIIEGLKDGTIDFIATDHAPHTLENKAEPFDRAMSGIIGLETSLGLGILKLVQEGHLTLLQLIEKMSTNPAELYHLDAGYLAEGGPADLVLFAPEETFVAGNYASKAVNTPFTGWTLPGKVKYTICNGQVVYKD